MYKNKIFGGILIIGLAVILAYTFFGRNDFVAITNKDFETYKNNLLEMSDSPIKEKSSDGFRFYKPNENWVIPCKFTKKASPFNYTMTDSTLSETSLAGFVTFEKDGKTFKMLLFKEGESYLLSFKDKSSGKSTYGGGRYIIISKLNQSFMLDFNKARNFYCAYNHDFVCPIPPAQNFINLEVNAGEQKYVSMQ